MIPDYQTLMRPVLDVAKNGEVSVKHAVARLASDLHLTESEKSELLPSGRQTVIANRVHWAKTYLKQAGLVDATRRGHFRITAQGKAALESSRKIDRKYLLQFPSFVEFVERGKKPDLDNEEREVVVAETTSTPDEQIRKAFDQINEALTVELLDRVRESAPEFFENLIVELLVAMGYGGTSEDPGRALGRSGDEGVDGVIDQDPLGVDQIYIQAKRYKDGNPVGPGAIRDFFGSLSLKHAHKGIFVTTSVFTGPAVQTARGLLIAYCTH